MTRTWSLFARMSALVAAVTLAHCSSASSGSTPTCAQAFDHLYSEECEVVVDGTALTESQAIDFCTESQTQVSDVSCPCGSDMDDYLSCASTITVCGSCSDEFSAWDACLNANPGCSP